MEHRDDSLAARLREGSHDAAGELVDAYYKQMFLFMRRLGFSRQISEDLTQDCFLQAWQHVGQLRNDAALNGWLYRIAINAAKLYWRKHKYDQQNGLEEFDLQSDQLTGDDQIEQLDQLRLLNDLVAKLPKKLKQTVILHYMQHLTIAEAAEAVGIAKGTFKSRLSRALKLLQKQLASESEKTK